MKFLKQMSLFAICLISNLAFASYTQGAEGQPGVQRLIVIKNAGVEKYILRGEPILFDGKTSCHFEIVKLQVPLTLNSNIYWGATNEETLREITNGVSTINLREKTKYRKEYTFGLKFELPGYYPLGSEDPRFSSLEDINPRPPQTPNCLSEVQLLIITK